MHSKDEHHRTVRAQVKAVETWVSRHSTFSRSCAAASVMACLSEELIFQVINQPPTWSIVARDNDFLSAKAWRFKQAVLVYVVPAMLNEERPPFIIAAKVPPILLFAERTLRYIPKLSSQNRHQLFSRPPKAPMHPVSGLARAEREGIYQRFRVLLPLSFVRCHSTDNSNHIGVRPDRLANRSDGAPRGAISPKFA